MAAWLAAVLIACLLRECRCFTLVVDNQYQQVQLNSPAAFMCQANVALAGCQIIDFDINKIIDLSAGNRSKNYWGSGLEHGQCGFSSEGSGTVNGYNRYGCRARAHEGGWEYATTVIHVPDYNINGVIVLESPRVLFADVGSNVTFTFTADKRLFSSLFKWPGQNTWVRSGSNSIYSIDESKFAQGRYQLTLFKVTPNSSGIVTSDVRSPPNNGRRLTNIRLTTLIVKMAPSAPALSLSKADGVYNEGDVMLGSCHVGLARPVARITWLLNDDVIQGDAEDFSKWPWEFEAGSVTLNLSRHLSMSDDGKELVCRVHHIALPGGVVDARTKITVQKVQREATPCEAAQEKSDYLMGLLVGIGGSLAAVTVVVVVASLLGWANYRGKSCCVRQGTVENRESHIYENTIELRSEPTQIGGEVRESNVYANIRHDNQGQGHDDETVIYSN